MRAGELLGQRPERIDKFFLGLVNELAGPAGCGKSILCYKEILCFLQTRPGIAIILDTVDGFKADIFAALIRQNEPDRADELLERIQVMRTRTVYDILEAVREVAAGLRKSKKEGERIGVLCIDTIANPLGLLMQKGQQEGHALMVSITRELSFIARFHRVCIILVNTAVRIPSTTYPQTTTFNRDSAFDGISLQPALGKLWPHLIDYCMFVHPLPESAGRPLHGRGYIHEIIRSRIGGTGEWEVV
ncbi:hypothetical protein PYCC9005_002791 [Savitreella phatthalungensis]